MANRTAINVEQDVFQRCMECTGGEVAHTNNGLVCALAKRQGVDTLGCALPSRMSQITALVRNKASDPAELQAIVDQTTTDWINASGPKTQESPADTKPIKSK